VPLTLSPLRHFAVRDNKGLLISSVDSGLVAGKRCIAPGFMDNYGLNQAATASICAERLPGADGSTVQSAIPGSGV